MHCERIPFPGKPKVFLDCYLLDSGLRLGQDTARPAVMICPGGGYVYLSPREAEPVAMAYAARGIHAFVLNYSLGWDTAGFAPLTELDWAIALLRSHAAEWHIDPQKILTCGFSAGGHLALAGGLLGQERPNGVILGYPAIDFSSSESALIRTLFDEQDDNAPWISLQTQVTPDSPPVFLFTTWDDAMTRRMSLELAMAYERCNVPMECHIFGRGPHGYSLANAASVDGSSQVVSPHVEKWLELSVEWLFSVFGEPEMRDYSTSHIMDAIRELGIALPDDSDARQTLDNA